MKKIAFIQIYSKKYGGVIYKKKVQEALEKAFDLELLNLEARHFKNLKYLKIPESFSYLLKLKGERPKWPTKEKTPCSLYGETGVFVFWAVFFNKVIAGATNHHV